MSELKVDKITPRLGTTLTLGDTGDTINFGSGVLPNFENLTVTGDLTVDTNSLYVDSANNYVGIGTASPQKMLHILNTATTGVTSTTPIHLRLEGNNSNYYDIGRDNQNTGFLSFYGNQSGANGYIFGGANGERMRIDSSGFVGIGTSNPTNFLSVEGEINGDWVTEFKQLRTTAGTSYGVQILGGTNSSDIAFQVQNATASNTLLRVRGDGNVGIGTSSPASKLEVEDSLNGDMHLRINNTSTGSSARTFLLLQSDGATGSLYLNGANRASSGVDEADSMTLTSDASASNGLNINATSGSIKFYYNTSEKMRIDSSGNVLVGKTSSGVANVGAELRNGSSNYALLGTASGEAPIILNRTTSDGDIIKLRKDNTAVGVLGVNSSDNIYFAGSSGGTKGIYFSASSMAPANTGGATLDNSVDIGSSGVRWKDLYLSGSVYLGGTGTANALDDYEEGTWTPTISGTSSAPTYFNRAGTYTKVGNLVTATLFLQTNAVSFSNNNDPLKITGYPFTPTGNTGYGYFIGSLSSQTFYYNGTYNDYGTTGVCHPEFQAVDSTIRFIVTASGAIRGTVKNLGMTVSGLVLQCWFQHYAT